MKRLAIVLLSLLPGACHFKWSGPFLYSHNSSSAFDLWAVMWLGCIFIVAFALCVDLKPSPPQKETR